MKSLKSLSILAILAAFGIVVYSYVNSLPEPVPPAGVQRDWNAGAAARIDMSGMEEVQPGRDIYSPLASSDSGEETPLPMEEAAMPPPPGLAPVSGAAIASEAPVPALPPLPVESAPNQPNAAAPMADVRRAWLNDQGRGLPEAQPVEEPLTANAPPSNATVVAQTAGTTSPWATAPSTTEDSPPAEANNAYPTAGVPPETADIVSQSVDIVSQSVGAPNAVAGETVVVSELSSDAASGTGSLSQDTPSGVAEDPREPAAPGTETLATVTTLPAVPLGPPTEAAPPLPSAPSITSLASPARPAPEVPRPEFHVAVAPPSESPAAPDALQVPTTNISAETASPATPVAEVPVSVAGIESPPATAPTVGDPPAASPIEPSFDIAWTKAVGLLQAGKLDGALSVLSAWYKHPSLRPEEQHELTGLLGQLSGTVIYSESHHFEPPYVVQQEQESLAEIAAQYQVPPSLLARINGIDPEQPLPRGRSLKVVRGPFEGEVRVVDRELVLKLNGRYAGRFRLGVGEQADGAEGEYLVQKKEPTRAYYAANRTIPPGDAQNPYAKHWIGLSRSLENEVHVPLGLHGSWDAAAVDRDDPRGCLRLAPQDAADVYDILSVGSRVRVLR